MSARAAVALAALVAALALPAAARADAVSGPGLRVLAAQAKDDPAALARLRRVTTVDGRPVDIAGSLRGASGGTLRGRLEALAAPAGDTVAADAASARARARATLAERRFRGTHLGGPFHAVLDRLGRLVRPVRRLIPALDRLLPGGPWVPWTLLAVLVMALGWLVAGRAAARRAAQVTAAARAAGARRESPAALERRAEDAARAGDHEAALRLRFRAGLLRLDARGAIAFRPSLPTGEVARTLRSKDFDRLAATFDEVVYGHRPARPDDVEAARAGWAAVLGAR